MMRYILAATTAFCVSGCTEVIPPSVGDGPGNQRAFFAEFPDALFAGAREACKEPGDTLSEPAPRVVRCETLPPPRVAAALILQYDGSLQKIPTLINTLSAEPRAAGEQQGFVVSADYFVQVPQKNGSSLAIRLADDRVQRNVRRAFTLNGGQPILAE